MISNPPYIPSGTRLERSVADFEPHEALFAEADGMEVIRPLVKAARENPTCRGMMMEMQSDQWEKIEN
jgi:release factor glutamine methyltransferase